MDAALLILNGWAKIKKEEISTMTKAQIASARAKAYGGAGNTQNTFSEIIEVKDIKLIITRVCRKYFF